MILRLAILLGLLAPALFAQPVPSPTPESSAAPAASPPAVPPATPPKAEASPTPPPPRLTTRALIEGLPVEDVTKAIQAVEKKFLDPARTEAEARERATLEGLIRQLAPGISLRDAAHPPSPTDHPAFLAEILDARIAYIRPGSLTANSLAQLDATLSGLDPKAVSSVILDLRGIPAGGSFEMAADFARRFCAKGKLLFSLQKPSAKQERIFTSNQDPAFQGILVVLTDTETAGPAEALAGTLRLNAGAMIIGADTTGEAVEFDEIPLGKNAILRVATSQVILPESGPIFPDGIKPDVAISLPEEIRDRIFALSTESGVSQFVFATSRTHMNEASLVANVNPEIDAARAARENQNRPPKLRDTVLQRAVDLVTAIDFYRTRK